MTIWMLYAILFAGLAAAGALALERAARALRLPTRFIWLGALAVAIAGPIALPSLIETQPVSTSPAAGTAAQVGSIEVASGPRTAPTLDLTVWARRLDQPLFLLWIALTALCLGRFAQGMVALRRQRRHWVAREVDGTPLLVTPDLGPAVVAIPEPRIIVPEWVLALDQTSLATIIRHERQHTAAGDAWLIITGAIATSLLPWNPAMWLIRRRLRLALEVDCDARVLAEEPQVDRYGSLLMQIAQHPRGTAALSATLAESTSDLERRIDAMTTRPSKYPRLRATLFGSLAAAAIALAFVLPAPAIAAPTANAQVSEMAPQAVLEFQVQSAKPDPNNLPPRYPDSLRARRIEGEVVARFVVDTNGAIDPRSFEVVKADHPAFATAVREHLPNVRFSPARAGGRKLKQLVQMPFKFSLTHDPASIPRVVHDTPSPSKGLAGGTKPERTPDRTPPEVVSAMQRPAANAAPASDTMPQPLPTNTPPIYPNQLRAANIEGKVLAEFVVDADGNVDMSTFNILKSSHEMFSAAVRVATVNLKFRPAMKDGVPVPKKIEMPFTFSLAK